MYRTVESVESLLEESLEKKVLILKHSATCPTSARAKRQVDALLELQSDRDIYLVIVQKERDISREIAERLNVKHESPQFLVVREGKAAHVLNHGEITRDAVEERIQKTEEQKTDGEESGKESEWQSGKGKEEQMTDRQTERKVAKGQSGRVAKEKKNR